MKSYQTGRNLFGTWTKNTDATNLTFGDQVANDDYRALCALKDWPFLEKQRTMLTVASQQFYNLPYDCDLVREVAVTLSTMKYVPKLSPSQAHWDHLNLTTFTSDFPQWYFVLNGQLGLWPKPATSNNTITITQKTRVIDLSTLDYTTGSIVSIANGATTVTGTGTTWTSQMVGRFIKITLDGAVSGAKGDDVWYEISSVTSATVLELVRKYGGTTIAAATAPYTIGQMPLLPEAYHDLPWMWAAGMYWNKEADPMKRGSFFLASHGTSGGGNTLPTGKVRELIMSYSSPTTDMVLDDGGDHDIINPNLTIQI